MADSSASSGLEDQIDFSVAGVLVRSVFDPAKTGHTTGNSTFADFTITWRGVTYYWEHLGLLEQTKYAEQWQRKQVWYDRWFPGKLLTTEEGPHLSKTAAGTIEEILAE